ncbi:tyrosine-type recombinase/integrase [Cytobacillus horneckiae]|uniref:tyrosine-type recombinase/integrase n=1 Tax=Cytobacillus horneckiae TaxID=549687 RepID=UPI002DBC1EA7|nr:tyrosine-type recombinase/integrase [Cytobacillus horneckiae]MEC1158580.1 tyrosine-type recombinase/integrase [Cytobacillus horneckiae]MED2940835.1 tyrosine-type recombinase/integrase [Cytobacillus horneckiae]
MAYIYKRGKKWAYRAYAGKDPITEKDKQVSKSGFLTKKDAQLAAALFERQFHNDEYIQPSKITFNALSDDWEKHYLQTMKAKESSLRARKIALKHIKNEFGEIAIQKISKKAYQDTIDKLSKEFSTNYVSSIHTSANMVFEYAKENKLIKEVPTMDITLPKKKKTVADLEKGDSIKQKFLEKEELGEFLNIAKNDGLEGDLLTFTLLAYTGLRAGEMIALKWSDIDFDNQTLTVYRTYYNPTNNKAKYTLLTPKTQTSHRTITIDKLVIDLLQVHKEEQDEIKKKNEPFYQDNNFIFATNEGYPKTIKAISIRLQRLLTKTKIKKDITPHSFRHTHTSLLIEANVHIKEIQERLGHSDINTTMDIYAHMTKNIKKEASTKFGNLMKDLSKNLIDSKHEQKHEHEQD